MAMNATVLADDITDALINAGIVNSRDRSDLSASMKVLAGAIVSHIQTHAEVSTTVATGIAVSTTGTAAAQTGATTATGTGTGGIS